MARIILVLCLLCSFVANAQYPPGYTGINQRYDWFLGKFRGLHLPSRGAGDTTFLSTQWRGSGAVVVDTVNNKFYFYSGGRWREASGGSDGGIHSANAGYGLTQVNDSTLRADSTLLATKLHVADREQAIRSALIDTAAAIRADFPVGGGGSTDTTSLSARIDWKETVFNVKQYGAVGDGVTDDRAAIQATINAASAAGGGIVYFPNGVYWLGTGITDGRGQLVIPMHAYINSSTTPTIKFLGETATPDAFAPEHVTGVRYPSDKGVVLKSGIPVGTNSSVIGSYGTTGGAWSVQNFTRLVIENICVRVYATDAVGAVAAAKDTAINAYALSHLELNHVLVDVACSNDSLLQPATTSVGIITPPNTNWVKNDHNDVWVIGQYKGMVIYEHANLDNVYFDACYYGIHMPGSNHTSHANRVGFWRCKISIKISSDYSQAITIDQYNVERRVGSEWYAFVADLEEDTTGYASGHIRYSAVFGANTFIRSNPAGSRIFSVGVYGTGYRWSTANRPSNADTATVGLNLTTLNMEYKKAAGSSGFTEIPSIGQTRNLWVDNPAKVAIGGDPNSSTYLFNIYGDSAATGNLANYVTASTLGQVLFNNTKASGQGRMATILQRGATALWTYGADFNNDSSWFLYDNINAVSKIWANNGILHLGASASSFSGAGSGISILANRQLIFNDYGTGANTGTPAYSLSVDASGNVIETAVGGTVTGTGAANRGAYWSSASALTSTAAWTFDGNTMSIKPATYWTSNYHFRVGDFITQNYALNNTFFMDNAYFNGSFTRLNTGYASGFQFYNGQLFTLHAGTGTGTFTATIPFKVDNLGVGVMGGNIVNTPGTYTGAAFLSSTARINSASIHYFGDITTTPTARIHIAAGTTSVPPLQFTSGPLTTGADILAGNVEFLTDKWYGTITTGPAAKEFTMNDAALTSGRVPVATTNGRLTDDADMTFTGSTLKLGVAGSTVGQLDLTGSTSGTISIKGVAAAGTYNFNLPATAGAAGDYLTSGGGGAAAMTWTTPTTLASGTFTPTPTHTTNIASSTVYDLQYLRVGNTVTVSGKVDITTTATGASELRMTVPVSNGNFSSDGQAGGTAHPVDKSTGSIGITSNSGSVLVAFRFISDDTSAHTYWFSYTYQILIP